MTDKVVHLKPRANALPDNRRLFTWLRQVQQDPAISSSGFELAFVIMQHINNSSGLAWPTQETLARAVNVSDRTVRTLTEALASNGHIAVQHGQGRNTPNRYRLIWKNEPDIDNERRKPASAYEAEKEEADFRSNDENTETDFLITSDKAEAGFRISGPITGNPLHDMRKFSALNAEADFRQNYPQELPSITNSETIVSAKSKIKKAPPPKSDQTEKAPDADLYRRGKEILGQSAGGMISKLLKAKGGNVALARAALETASTKDDPREFVGKILSGANSRDSPEDLRARGEAW